MSDITIPPVAPWRRMLAYCCYAWGLSWCYWGIQASHQGFLHTGIRWLDRAVRLWPAFAQGMYRRGLMRGRELNDYAAGIDDMTRVISVAPEWPEPYLQRGLFARFRGDARAALVDFQHYLTIAEDPFWRGEAERQSRAVQAELDADDTVAHLS